jgi:hypothetical protein
LHQDSREAPILRANTRVGQLAIAERYERLIGRPIEDQGTGLPGQIDQVEQLGDREITEIAA